MHGVFGGRKAHRKLRRCCRQLTGRNLPDATSLHCGGAAVLVTLSRAQAMSGVKVEVQRYSLCHDQHIRDPRPAQVTSSGVGQKKSNVSPNPTSKPVHCACWHRHSPGTHHTQSGDDLPFFCWNTQLQHRQSVPVCALAGWHRLATHCGGCGRSADAQQPSKLASLSCILAFSVSLLMGCAGGSWVRQRRLRVR